MTTRRRNAESNDALEDYRRKRDFSQTAEPVGGDLEASTSGRLFCVQKHAARQLHYDFRLELDGVLKSWAVPKGPSLDPRQKLLAVLVEDHPLEYARFEGAIPRGEYGGGTVMLWDLGEWEPIGDPREGLAHGDLKFRLHGSKLRGEWVLARMSGKAGGDGRNWLLIKKKDEQARPVAKYNILAEMPRSVLSGRTLDEITADPAAVWKDGRAQQTARERPPADGPAAIAPGAALPDPAELPRAVPASLPEKLAPQLATPARHAPDGDEWLHEIKLDGYRLLCRIQNGAARLITRNGHDWTDRFANLAAAAGRLPLADTIIDGEVVVLDERGVSSFQALQNAFRGYTPGHFTYYAFDLPFALGHDLRKAPLLERKRFLRALLDASPSAAPVIQFCDHMVGRGPLVFAEAAQAGLEGIISKRVDSRYVSRRTDSWLKVKAKLREDFVVGGYTDPAGSRAGFGALLLGRHDRDGRLVYRGRVGTGFDERTLGLLHEQLQSMQRADAPFLNPELDPDVRRVHWVNPDLVIEVEFTAWTDDRLVRHGAFIGLRPDIDPRDVVDADAAGATGRRKTPDAGHVVRKVVRAPHDPDDAFVRGVRISNPGRTVYPDDGVSKLDVAMYYEAIADRILPHLVGRPLSLVRCPLGLAGDSFYQRQLGEGFPDALDEVTIDRNGSEDHAIVIRDLDGLLSLVQMGTLEIHAWGCRVDNLDRPDRLVFDLDPGPGIEWSDVVGSAEVIRDYLGELGLQCFAKTTGGKGIHLVIPIQRRTSWEQAKAFTKAVADSLVRLAPRNFVATMTKSLRINRIFIDYLRNQMGSTAVAAWSTRARNGATVSTPLAWDELSSELTPGALNVRSVPSRLRDHPDPWPGFDDARQSITKAMLRAVGASD